MLRPLLSSELLRLAPSRPPRACVAWTGGATLGSPRLGECRPQGWLGGQSNSRGWSPEPFVETGPWGGGAGQCEAGSCPGRRGAIRGYHRTSAVPTGEQPDASLPLHVLPLYSLLAPEKQAQVRGRGRGRGLAGRLPCASRRGRGRPRRPPCRLSAQAPVFESIGVSSFPAFSLGALQPEARRGPGHRVTPRPTRPAAFSLIERSYPTLTPREFFPDSGASLPPAPPH